MHRKKNKIKHFFYQAFFQRIDNISLREIKDVDPGLTFKLIRLIQNLLDDHLGKEAYQITETAESNFTLEMIKSPFLEKRINGVQEFKDLKDRVEQDSDMG